MTSPTTIVQAMQAMRGAVSALESENRVRDAAPELLAALKALLGVVGAQHLTTDTLHIYLDAKNLIERMEGSGT